MCYHRMSVGCTEFNTKLICICDYSNALLRSKLELLVVCIYGQRHNTYGSRVQFDYVFDDWDPPCSYSIHPAYYSMLCDLYREFLLSVYLQSTETLHFPYSGFFLVPSIFDSWSRTAIVLFWPAWGLPLCGSRVLGATELLPRTEQLQRGIPEHNAVRPRWISCQHRTSTSDVILMSRMFSKSHRHFLLDIGCHADVTDVNRMSASYVKLTLTSDCKQMSKISHNPDRLKTRFVKCRSSFAPELNISSRG